MTSVQWSLRGRLLIALTSWRGRRRDGRGAGARRGASGSSARRRRGTTRTPSACGGSARPTGTTMSRIRFEAGARTNWHTHTAPQMLWSKTGVAAGRSMGDAVKDMLKDVPMLTRPNVMHWHGAAPDQPCRAVQRLRRHAQVGARRSPTTSIPGKNDRACSRIDAISAARLRFAAGRGRHASRARRKVPGQSPPPPPVRAGARPPPLPPVTSQDHLDGLKHPSRWLTYSGDYTGRRHSPLKQITPANASRLAAQWTFQAEAWSLAAASRGRR